MSSPDFNEYSIEELKDALRNIDRERFPDRVKHIESILKNPKERLRVEIRDDHRAKMRARREEKESKKNEPLWYAVIYGLLALLALFTGVIGSKHSAMEVTSWEARIMFTLLFGAVAYSNFSKYRNRKRPRSLTRR